MQNRDKHRECSDYSDLLEVISAKREFNPRNLFEEESNCSYKNGKKKVEHAFFFQGGGSINVTCLENNCKIESEVVIADDDVGWRDFNKILQKNTNYSCSVIDVHQHEAINHVHYLCNYKKPELKNKLGVLFKFHSSFD